MLKKALLAFSLVAMLALVAAPVFAQAPTTPEEMEAAFKKEAALTQADIDAYLTFAPKLVANSSNPQAVASVFKDAGLTDIRGAYIAAKIAMAQIVALTGDKAALAQAPEYFHPTDDEIALVKKNMDAITKAQTPAVAQ